MIINFKRKPPSRGPATARQILIDDISAAVDPAELAAIEAADEASEGSERARAGRPKRERLSRSTDQEDPFSRVWFSWFDAYPGLFSPLTRLWLVLWYRSREGTEPIQITRDLAKEARIHLEDRDRYARRLERLGVVRVERQPGQLLTLTMLVPSPARKP